VKVDVGESEPPPELPELDLPPVPFRLPLLEVPVRFFDAADPGESFAGEQTE